MTQTVLRIDASARFKGSTSRRLADQVVDHLDPEHLLTRDLADGLPQINGAWVDANFTPVADRTDDQRQQLALSDTLVGELQKADTVVIALPIYNFGVPASLKAWIDQIARAGVTFRYTPNGPEGLLDNKRAILVIASGGTEIDSAIDFATPYLRHVLGFVGITDVQVVRSDKQMVNATASSARASADIAALAA